MEESSHLWGKSGGSRGCGPFSNMAFRSPFLPHFAVQVRNPLPLCSGCCFFGPLSGMTSVRSFRCLIITVVVGSEAGLSVMMYILPGDSSQHISPSCVAAFVPPQ
jgi:hypothetical protein